MVSCKTTGTHLVGCGDQIDAEGRQYTHELFERLEGLAKLIIEIKGRDVLEIYRS